MDDSRRKLYEGKAKIVWEAGPGEAGPGAEAARTYIVEYKDDATAFDGKKRGRIGGKGRVNNLVSALLFDLLEREGVPTHFVRTLGDREMLVRRVKIIPVEVVVRNVAAGSLAKRLGLEEGAPLARTVLEHYYKSDELGDPLINRYHLRTLDLAADPEIDRMESLALRINDILGGALEECGLRLIDFKLEFGRTDTGEVILADEISPDTCRFWDTETNEKLDKDRFRRDLGDVEEAYEEVLRRVTAGAEKWRVRRRGARASGGERPAHARGEWPAHARVFVTLKSTVLDPQGAAVENALRTLGYDEVKSVRVGKFITLELTHLSPERVDEMCRRLLANPVIEDYRFEVVPATAPPAGSPPPGAPTGTGGKGQ